MSPASLALKQTVLLTLFAAVNLTITTGCDKQPSRIAETTDAAAARDDYYAYTVETVSGAATEDAITSVDFTVPTGKVSAGLLSLNHLVLDGDMAFQGAAGGAFRQEISSPLCTFQISSRERSRITVEFSKGAKVFHLEVLPGLSYVKFYPTFEHAFLTEIPPQGEQVGMTATLVPLDHPQNSHSVSREITIEPATAISLPASIKSLLPLVSSYSQSLTELIGDSPIGRRPADTTLESYAQWLASTPLVNGWELSLHGNRKTTFVKLFTEATSSKKLAPEELIAYISALAVTDGWSVWLYQTKDRIIVAITSGDQPGGDTDAEYLDVLGYYNKRADSVLSSGRASFLGLATVNVPSGVSVNQVLPYYAPSPEFSASPFGSGGKVRSVEEIIQRVEAASSRTE